jgi:4,5-dihydroxyphthalate decarboxylase
MTRLPILKAAIGDYPHTAALRLGHVSSPLLALDLVTMPVINRAFAPMVRELRFHVSEMAIATFLQAKSFGKPLVLLPIVLAARFQQSALLCLKESPIRGPADLVDRRIGVRAYSQTTGLWLRGILADTFGVLPEQVRWVTIEDAHVAEYRDPAYAERAPAGSDLLAMLRAGLLDAVIVGNDIPGDADLRPVFPDLHKATASFWDEHRFVPVNHIVTVRQDIAEQQPALAVELVRMFGLAAESAKGNAMASEPVPDAAGLHDSVALALHYATEQGLLGQSLSLEDVWQGTPWADSNRNASDG